MPLEPRVSHLRGVARVILGENMPCVEFHDKFSSLPFPDPVQIANVESEFATALSDSGEITVEGKVKDGKPHLTKVGSFGVDVSLEGSLIFCRHIDQPGMIGKVGSVLGDENVNVSFMSVGRITFRKQAVMTIGVEEFVFLKL